MFEDRKFFWTPFSRCTVRRGVAALAVLTALLAGCSGPRAAPVDADRARDALKTTLEGWKKGDQAADLRAGSPPITAQDLDWMGGARLTAYQVTDQGKTFGPNLHVPVKLTLRAPDGKELQKSVNYIVGTSPSLTVFRALR